MLEKIILLQQKNISYNYNYLLFAHAATKILSGAEVLPGAEAG